MTVLYITYHVRSHWQHNRSDVRISCYFFLDGHLEYDGLYKGAYSRPLVCVSRKRMASLQLRKWDVTKNESIGRW